MHSALKELSFPVPKSDEMKEIQLDIPFISITKSSSLSVCN